MAPWARIIAQILMPIGQAFVRAFAQAYQQAQHRYVWNVWVILLLLQPLRIYGNETNCCIILVNVEMNIEGAGGGKHAAKEAADRMMGKMTRGEAMKILNLENKVLTPELVTQVSFDIWNSHLLFCDWKMLEISGNFYKLFFLGNEWNMLFAVWIMWHSHIFGYMWMLKFW